MDTGMPDAHRDQTGLRECTMWNSAEKGKRADQTRTSQRHFAGTEILQFNSALLKIEINLVLQLLMCFGVFQNTERFPQRDLGIKTEMNFQHFWLLVFLEPLSLYVIPPSGDEIWNGISSFSNFQFLFELYFKKHVRHQPFHKGILVHFDYLQTWNGNGLEGHHHCATLNHFPFFTCHTSLYL